MTVSIRDALQLGGQAASIKHLAHRRQASFPLSLREFVGAPPPGRIVNKTLSLALLQRKLDEFFNHPERRPLFELHLHNNGSGDHRHSTLDLLFDHPARGYTSQLRDGVPRDLGQLEIDLRGPFNPNYHFSGLTSAGVTVNVVAGPPAGLEAVLRFETEGEELKINNFPNINLRFFKITLRFTLALDSANHLVALHTDASQIATDAAVDTPGLPDGVVAGKVEGAVNDRIAEALADDDTRTKLNRLVTRWLVGGDFAVLAVDGNEHELSIDYLVPPGQLPPFAEQPQAPLDPGPLANIEHIVVLMMENRSFDHMLGYLSKQGGRDDVDGLRGGETNPYKGRAYASFPLDDTIFMQSPGHGHASVVNQVDGGKLDGFVADFARQYEADGVDPGAVMGYLSAAQVPVYDAIAREFMLCQRWFAAHPGPTFPNRFYTLTGRLNRDANGRFQFDNPHGDDFTPVHTRTIFDHLSERAIPWHYYEHGYCFLRMFARYTTDDAYIVDARDPVRGFFASARTGALPAVSFIDPDFIDVPPGNDDGPPADVAAGQRLIGEIVQALMEGPGWSKTLLVVTYDEHGGFYDHVVPPAAVPVSAINEYGVRVPALVVSPWVDRGAVSDLVFDHTTIAKTIARCFMSADPPDMGERVAAANDLGMVLRTTPREDRPSIPLPPAPAPPSAEVARLARLELEDDTDFKGILQALRARYPVLI